MDLLNPYTLTKTKEFRSSKEELKEYLAKAIDLIVLKNQHRDKPYYVIFHEKTDGENSRQKIKILETLPGFVTNSIVFWVCNKRSICEVLWTVPPNENGKTRKVHFNTEGVAYLQAKGAMPKQTGDK